MKLYVGTYYKYNCGSLFGKWLDLNDFSDAEEFISACYELHQDEKDPEFMFQDYEADADWENSLYCECSFPRQYWEIKEELKKQFFGEDVFSSFVSVSSEHPSAELVRKCADSFRGTYNSLSDYVESFYEETGMMNEVPDFLQGYIDFERIGRDWEFEGNITFVDNYVFQRW